MTKGPIFFALLISACFATAHSQKCVFGGTFSITLNEDFPIGTNITTDVTVTGDVSKLEATDTDGFVGGKLVDGKVVIYLKRKLDTLFTDPSPTAKNYFVIAVSCWIGTQVAGTQHISAVVNDVNNHYPIFEDSPYNFNWPETCLPKYVNAERPIRVQDKDLRTGFGKLTITAEPTDLFELEIEEDKSTRFGAYFILLKFKPKPAVYEPKTYEIKLIASDPDQAKTATVEIKIEDTDDKDPIFEEPIYTADLHLQEKGDVIQVKDADWTDFKPGSPGMLLPSVNPRKVHAYDQDKQLNVSLKYEILNADAKKYFVIDGGATHSSPGISLINIDDHLASLSSVGLLIKASQYNDVNRSANALLVVKPIVTKPDPFKFLQSVQVLRKTKVGDTVYVIQHSDTTANVEYVLSGKDASKFDRVGKNITLKEEFDDLVQLYEIDIQVTEITKLSKLTQVLKVNIHVVEKLGQLDALFKKSVFAGDVFSGAMKGYEVLTVETQKDDVKINLTGVDEESCERLFELQPSGKLVLAENLSEDVTTCTLHIEGKLEGRTTPDHTKVIVSVVEKRDYLPALFNQSVFVVEVFSDTSTDTEVLQVKTENGVVVTLDEAGNTEEDCKKMFRLQSAVFLVAGPLGSVDKTCKFKIFGVLDKRGETALVIIRIVPKKPAPGSLFEKSVYVADLYADAEQDTKILDIGTISDVEITLQNSGVFDLMKPRTIVLKGAIDPKVDKYELNLKATLGDRQEEAKVIVYVLRRRNTNIFAKSQYTVDVSKYQPVGSELFKIETLVDDSNVVEAGDKNQFLEYIQANKTIKLLKELQPSTTYELALEGSLTSLPTSKDFTKVIFRVSKDLLGYPKFFKGQVFKLTVKAGFSKEQELINVKADNSPPAKFQLITSLESFRITNEGSLFLKVDYDDLKDTVHVVRIKAVPSESYYANTVSQLEDNEAVALITKERTLKFLDSSPLIKILFPSPFLSDYTFQIKLSHYDGTERFEIRNQEPPGSIDVESTTGLVYFLFDITSRPTWKSNATVRVTNKEGQTADLDLMLLKLKEDQFITLKSNEVNLTTAQVSKAEIEKMITRALNYDEHTFLVTHVSVDSTPARSDRRRFYRAIEDPKTTSIVGALLHNHAILSYEQSKVVLEKAKDNLQNALGDHSFSEYKDLSNPDPVEAQTHAPPTDLLAAVIALGSLLLLLMLATSVLLFLMIRRPELLKKLNPWKKSSTEDNTADTGSSGQKNKGEINTEPEQEEDIEQGGETPSSQRPLVGKQSPRVAKAEELETNVPLYELSTEKPGGEMSKVRPVMALHNKTADVHQRGKNSGRANEAQMVETNISMYELPTLKSGGSNSTGGEVNHAFSQDPGDMTPARKVNKVSFSPSSEPFLREKTADILDTNLSVYELSTLKPEGSNYAGGEMNLAFSQDPEDMSYARKVNSGSHDQNSHLQQGEDSSVHQNFEDDLGDEITTAVFGENNSKLAFGDELWTEGFGGENEELAFGEDEIVPDMTEAVPQNVLKSEEEIPVSIPEEDYEGSAGDPGSTPHTRKKHDARISINEEEEDSVDEEDGGNEKADGENEEAEENSETNEEDTSDDEADVPVKKSVVKFNDTPEVIHL